MKYDKDFYNAISSFPSGEIPISWTTNMGRELEGFVKRR